MHEQDLFSPETVKNIAGWGLIAFGTICLLASNKQTARRIVNERGTAFV
jgi:hypothetical protein